MVHGAVRGFQPPQRFLPLLLRLSTNRHHGGRNGAAFSDARRRRNGPMNAAGGAVRDDPAVSVHAGSLPRGRWRAWRYGTNFLELRSKRGEKCRSFSLSLQPILNFTRHFPLPSANKRNSNAEFRVILHQLQRYYFTYMRWDRKRKMENSCAYKVRSAVGSHMHADCSVHGIGNTHTI